MQNLKRSNTKELKKPIVKSTTDKLNDVVDNFVGTKLGSKYNYLTNTSGLWVNCCNISEQISPR